MSTITNPSRISKDVDVNGKEKPRLPDVKLESRLNIKDLEALQDAFMEEGEGYDDRLSLTKEQFCEALSLILNKGTREEYADLFDKIDVTKEGTVDWDKFASHMLLEFREKDDRVKSTQVPQWKDLRNLPSPHKEVIQKVAYLKNTNRYIGISKEGAVSMWSQNLKLTRSLKTGTDSCRARDLWVTNFVPLHNINKIALSFTSKEIAVYDLSTKLEFNCQYKVQGLDYTPITLDYWSDPQNPNEAILVWGDTGGAVNALHFTSANIALFERPSAPAGEKQEPCLNVQLKDVAKKKYKNARYMKHQGHSEWVRQVVFSAHLECFISCATNWKNALVIGWLEKHSGTVNQSMKLTTFEISQGVNAFDYHEQLNLIATAGVNHHVCLWNPYVVSKPNGVLRGHMASVIQVQFNKPRGQLISFSKDKVLRIWDVQLQVCIQRLAGMFPKGPEVFSTLYFDDRLNRLFITFNYQLTMLEMKVEIKDRIMSHDKPIIAALYNSTYNQVVSLSQEGNMTVWMIDTGQKVKTFPQAHGEAEVTCMSQDMSETRLYTGSTDGTVKIWDFNFHCYHTLKCAPGGQPADVGQVLVLKRSVLVVGWTKYICVFRTQNFKDFYVEPSDWKGGQEHSDDILAQAFCGPNTLATGAYDGEIVIWNNNSEQASRHMTQRSRKKVTKGRTFISRESTAVSQIGTKDGGFDSHSFVSDGRPKSKSRAASRVSEGQEDDSNEYGSAIARLLFLTVRKGNSASGGANLVSCGGNGWVRFWNTANNTLVGEYVAHTQVGSIIMASDKDNHYLVTGDVDGLVKSWDISEYCVKGQEDLVTKPPPLIATFQPHSDMVTSISMCVRNERTLILTSSSDCSMALHDIHGNQIGIFGQEAHWKIEPYVPKEESDDNSEKHAEQNQMPEDEEEKPVVDVEVEIESDWEPDEEAVTRPDTHRINSWEQTVLGKNYQELRVKKRQRRQPGIIPDLPYLHWERTGDPPAGPYAALDTPELDQVGSIEKPDFVANPHKYFLTRSASSEKLTRLPALAETLTKAFDENSLFPTYILDFESKMKRTHQKQLQDNQKKAGTGLLKNVLSKPEKEPIPMDKRSNITSPGKRSSHKLTKLKPLSSVKSGSYD